MYQPRHWINCGQAGPLGWTIPAAPGVATAAPGAQVVALSGYYDFPFMLEELATGPGHAPTAVGRSSDTALRPLFRQTVDAWSRSSLRSAERMPTFAPT